ncbi:hypothetical protein PVL29_008983 [Vitis rotundifolia]|uniref:Uncharacterized protein n=1 Tax=Vitis rotundifolia TaxID=103349 RepID=A0AA39DTK3_VITRO|nr:hypothetical protein PVL29_008983 [Vitis rotundifolia]
MDTSFKYTGLCSNEAPSVVGRTQEEAAAAGGDGELNGLLRRRQGGMPRGRRKPELKVQWNDEKEKELAQERGLLYQILLCHSGAWDHNSLSCGHHLEFMGREKLAGVSKGAVIVFFYGQGCS